MEERIIEKDESRKIKIKHTAEGDDVVDDLAPDDAAEAAEDDAADYSVELPDEEYDEDLVGLTPSQLSARLEARERAAARAREEYRKILEEAEPLLKEANYSAAEPLYAQAALYECDDGTAKRGLWICRTENFTKTDIFYDEDMAQEFYWLDAPIREEALASLGDAVREARASLAAEAEPVRKRYEASKQERGEAFLANRNFYLVRFAIVLAVAVAAGIACLVSALYILRRSDNLALIFTVIFGVGTFVMLILTLIYALKLFRAIRLCRENEKPASSTEGARLEELEKKIACLDLVLGKQN